MSPRAIFDRAPLMPLSSCPLPAEALKLHNPLQEKLAVLAAGDGPVPMLWEPCLQMSLLSGDEERFRMLSGAVLAVWDGQKEDGSLAFSPEDSLCALRCGLIISDRQQKPELLRSMLNWCGWFYANQTTAFTAQLTEQPADLMDAVEQLYRRTGSSGLLILMEDIRKKSMDWSSVLHTVDGSIDHDAVSGDGRVWRQRHSESLAAGARAAFLNSLYSGNRQEAAAPKTGWEKLRRFHGSVCGGMTEWLVGTSLRNPIDTKATAAWCETLSGLDAAEQAGWAYDAAEEILFNTLASAVKPAGICRKLSVNSLRSSSAAVKDDTLTAAVLRGYLAAVTHAVTQRKDGLSLNILLPGRYTAMLGDKAARLTVAAQDDRTVAAVQVKEPVKAVIAVRLPAWAENPYVELDGVTLEPTCGYVRIERVWNGGEHIVIHCRKKLSTVNGYHRSVTVRYGRDLMTYAPDAEQEWAYAASGEPVLRDGQVYLSCRKAVKWSSDAGQPGDIPVLPAVTGDEEQLLLTPYRMTAWGISAFPGGGR